MPLMRDPNASLPDSYARSMDDHAWVWGPEIVHTWYTGNDMHNSWESTVHNVLQNYRGAEYFQKPVRPRLETLPRFACTRAADLNRVGMGTGSLELCG